MDDNTLFLIIAIISLSIGYLAGSLISSNRKSPEKQEPPQPKQPIFPDDALHIWRDSQSKQIVLQIGERLYKSSDVMSTTEKKFLGGLIAYLQRWLGITPPEPEQQPAPPPKAAEPAQASVSPFVTEPSEIPFSEKSIVAQIDDILQEKIFDTPLKDKGIRLMENLDGSMRVLIGMDQYDDVSSIPDETIKAAIRAAVKDWEQRQ